MKKAVKETPKSSSSPKKKNTRPHTTKRAGYNEDVFNAEEQRNYDKSEVAGNKRNTMGPKS